MEVGETRQVGGSKYLRLFERDYSHRGKSGKWLFASRDENPPTHENKKPDAVIVVPIHLGGTEPRIILTSEYRVPILTRELSFPAGLIDPEDYEGSESIQDAVVKAGVRECWEETNTDLVVKVVSPDNLYATAGLTNESAAFVFGTCTGEPSNKNSKKSEDIQVVPMDLSQIRDLLTGKGPYYNHALSVRAWMMLQPIVDHGWPDWMKK